MNTGWSQGEMDIHTVLTLPEMRHAGPELLCLVLTINGGTALREWVDDRAAQAGDLDAVAGPDEAAWVEMRRKYLRY